MRQVLSLVVCGSSQSFKSQSGPKQFNWRQLDKNAKISYLCVLCRSQQNKRNKQTNKQKKKKKNFVCLNKSVD